MVSQVHREFLRTDSYKQFISGKKSMYEMKKVYAKKQTLTDSIRNVETFSQKGDKSKY